MTVQGGRSGELLARASEARRQGRVDEARLLLEAAVAEEPNHAVALNSLGLIALGEGDSGRAIGYLTRAADRLG